ncbi:hypothetical protein THIOKS13330035 [Thiocapsa sp. KS1]|nr:hypothetical protein THIOKS13330035 [Thiocapsa sp. KS1]
MCGLRQDRCNIQPEHAIILKGQVMMVNFEAGQDLWPLAASERGRGQKAIITHACYLSQVAAHAMPDRISIWSGWAGRAGGVHRRRWQAPRTMPWGMCGRAGRSVWRPMTG